MSESIMSATASIRAAIPEKRARLMIPSIISPNSLTRSEFDRGSPGDNVSDETPYNTSYALLSAVRSGDEEAMNELLEAKDDVNTHSIALETAIFRFRDSEATVRLLLSRGADVNAHGGFYGNALQAAVVRGNDKIVKLLLDHGADVNSKGGLYSHALEAAILRNNDNAVKLLLDHGVNVIQQCGSYDNALEAAIARGNTNAANLLLDHGTNLQGKHSSDRPPTAVARGDKTVQPDCGGATNFDCEPHGAAFEKVVAISESEQDMDNRERGRDSAGGPQESSRCIEVRVDLHVEVDFWGMETKKGARGMSACCDDLNIECPDTQLLFAAQGPALDSEEKSLIGGLGVDRPNPDLHVVPTNGQAPELRGHGRDQFCPEREDRDQLELCLPAVPTSARKDQARPKLHSLAAPIYRQFKPLTPKHPKSAAWREILPLIKDHYREIMGPENRGVIELLSLGGIPTVCVTCRHPDRVQKAALSEIICSKGIDDLTIMEGKVERSGRFANCWPPNNGHYEPRPNCGASLGISSNSCLGASKASLGGYLLVQFPGTQDWEWCVLTCHHLLEDGDETTPGVQNGVWETGGKQQVDVELRSPAERDFENCYARLVERRDRVLETPVYAKAEYPHALEKELEFLGSVDVSFGRVVYSSGLCVDKALGKQMDWLLVDKIPPGRVGHNSLGDSALAYREGGYFNTLEPPDSFLDQETFEALLETCPHLDSIEEEVDFDDVGFLPRVHGKGSESGLRDGLLSADPAFFLSGTLEWAFAPREENGLGIRGDSGTWLFTESGRLLGQIFGYNAKTHMTYYTPIYMIFDDVRQRTGAVLRLPTKADFDSLVRDERVVVLENNDTISPAVTHTKDVPSPGEVHTPFDTHHEAARSRTMPQRRGCPELPAADRDAALNRVELGHGLEKFLVKYARGIGREIIKLANIRTGRTWPVPTPAQRQQHPEPQTPTY